MIKEAHLEITQRCNLACKHCYANRNPKDLPTKDWIKIMDRLKKMGVKKILLFGGEPTLRTDFYDLLDYATMNFENVSVQTNGTTETRLGNYNCGLNVSFEYIRADKNDEIRCGPGGNPMPFTDPDDTEKKCGQFKLALRKIVQSKNPKEIRYTIYGDAEDYNSTPLKMALAAHQLGANSVGVPLKPVGLGTNLRHLVPTSKQLAKWYKELAIFNSNVDTEHSIEEPQYYIIDPKLWKQHAQKFVKRGKICPAGVYRVFVDAKGNVSPCPFLQQFRLGNLLKDQVKSIEKRIKEFNQTILEIPVGGNCANCRWSSVCQGGCIVLYIQNKIKMGMRCPIVELEKDVQDAINRRKEVIPWTKTT